MIKPEIAARNIMGEICKTFGVETLGVEDKLNSLGKDGLLVSRFDDDEDGYKFRKVKYYDPQGLHLNRFYFAMASLVLKDVKHILEIGTGDALSTVTISSLWPDAQVFTFDLPPKDGMYKRWRQKSDAQTARNRQRKERLGRQNIKQYEINTFFLSTIKLPEIFEFILVDGDHVYPQLAGDIMFAYSRIKSGGFIFFHDYYEIKSPVCHVKEAVDWMEKRIPEKLFKFPMGTPPKTRYQKMALIVKGLYK